MMFVFPHRPDFGSSERRLLWEQAGTPEVPTGPEAEKMANDKDNLMRLQSLVKALEAIDSPQALSKAWHDAMDHAKAEGREAEVFRDGILAKMSPKIEQVKKELGRTDQSNENIRKNMENMLPASRDDMLALGLRLGIISLDSVLASEGRRERQEETSPGEQAIPQRRNRGRNVVRRALSDAEREEGSQLQRDYEALIRENSDILHNGRFRGLDKDERWTLQMDIAQRRTDILRRLYALGAKPGNFNAEDAQAIRRRMAGQSAAERRAMKSADLAQDREFRQAMLSQPGGSYALEQIDRVEREKRASERMQRALGIDAGDEGTRYDSRGFNRPAMDEGRYAPRAPQSYDSAVDRYRYPSSFFQPYESGGSERYLGTQDALKERYADQHGSELNRGIRKGTLEARYKDDPAYQSIMNAYGNAHVRWMRNPEARHGDVMDTKAQIGELEKRRQYRELMQNTLAAARENGKQPWEWTLGKEGGYRPEDRVSVRYWGTDGALRTFLYDPFYETGQRNGTDMTKWEDFVAATGIVIRRNPYAYATVRTRTYDRPLIGSLTFFFTKPLPECWIGGKHFVVGELHPLQKDGTNAPKATIEPKELDRETKGTDPFPIDLRRLPTWAPGRPGLLRVYLDGNDAKNDRSIIVPLVDLDADGASKHVEKGVVVLRKENGQYTLLFTRPGRYQVFHESEAGRRSGVLIDVNVRGEEKSSPSTDSSQGKKQNKEA